MLNIIADAKEILIKDYAILIIIIFGIVYCKCLISDSKIYKECTKLKKELRKIQMVIADDKSKYLKNKSK